MSRPARDDRGSPRRDEAARVAGHGPATTTHARSPILGQATISHDGWARWADDGPVIVGSRPAERGWDTPKVSQG